MREVIDVKARLASLDHRAAAARLSAPPTRPQIDDARKLDGDDGGGRDVRRYETLDGVYDPYVRLRPAPPTPADELCSCPDSPPILLLCAMGPNPLHCLHCNGEVQPSRLPLPADVANEVAHWAMVDGSIQRLELDSGLYEQWAQRELLDLGSAVNVEGLALRRTLDPIRRCYLVLFQSMDSSGRFVVPSVCPQCSGAFERFTSHGFTRLLCDTCGLAVVNP